MSNKIKTIEDIEKIYNELEEKLENLDENTDLDKLKEEVKKIQEDLDIEE
jgi:vacuolar-type H+-ATPase subunit E/Vma4